MTDLRPETLAAYRRRMRAASTPDRPMERLAAPGIVPTDDRDWSSPVIVAPDRDTDPGVVVAAFTEGRPVVADTRASLRSIIAALPDATARRLTARSMVPGNPDVVVLDEVLAVKFWLPLDPGERQDFIRSAFGDLDEQVRAARSGTATVEQEEVAVSLRGVECPETVGDRLRHYRIIDPLSAVEAALAGDAISAECSAGGSGLDLSPVTFHRLRGDWSVQRAVESSTPDARVAQSDPTSTTLTVRCWKKGWTPLVMRGDDRCTIIPLRRFSPNDSVQNVERSWMAEEGLVTIGVFVYTARARRPIPIAVALAAVVIR